MGGQPTRNALEHSNTRFPCSLTLPTQPHTTGGTRQDGRAKTTQAVGAGPASLPAFSPPVCLFHDAGEDPPPPPHGHCDGRHNQTRSVFASHSSTTTNTSRLLSLVSFSFPFALIPTRCMYPITTLFPEHHPRGSCQSPGRWRKKWRWRTCFCGTSIFFFRTVQSE